MFEDQVIVDYLRRQKLDQAGGLRVVLDIHVIFFEMGGWSGSCLVLFFDIQVDRPDISPTS